MQHDFKEQRQGGRGGGDEKSAHESFLVPLLQDPPSLQPESKNARKAEGQAGSLNTDYEEHLNTALGSISRLPTERCEEVPAQPPSLGRAPARSSSNRQVIPWCAA